MKRIQVIEDDQDIALLLEHALQREGGFEVALATDGEEGLRQALNDPPDLVLLDLNLPGVDGLEICRRLRAEAATRTIPIIMVTARVDEADRVAGLELGADDYILKPFSMKEVVARVRAQLRRAEMPRRQTRTLSAGNLLVDESRRRVTVDGEEIALTRKEFDLLTDLMQRRGRVVSREQLLARVWGYDNPGETRTVDVHVRHLRRKLGQPVSGWIETVVGVGYRFKERP
jgi:DNA-binding response OmpR family regulator